MIVQNNAFFQLLIQPMFADILPTFTGAYNGILGEFQVMDNVSLAHGTPLIELFGKGNILKRKDASCKTDWSNVATSGARKITITELYGAVEDCQEEFYQGCLKDFRAMNPRFRELILAYFKKILYLDLAVNSYFGDITRLGDTQNRYSWNAFDGIFTKIAEYIASGRIPSSQHVSIPAGDINPADAYALFQDMYDRQDEILDTEDDTTKAFYVNKKLAKAYERYLISVGNGSCCGVQYIKDGIPTLSYEGIPIFVEPIWDSVLKALNSGTQAHAAILTLRGNMVFGTDSSYGGGPNLNQALRVWWSDDDEVWRYKMYLTGGTELIAPQNMVVGTTF